MSGLFQAAEIVDRDRRSANASRTGRRSQLEADVYRSALVMTSAGLDASMTRLVNDAGRVLILKDNPGASGQFKNFLMQAMNKQSVDQDFKDAVLAKTPRDSLISYYLAEKTKASFQGSGDLINRVRNTLGLSQRTITDSELQELDPFFTARNNIVHDMDLKDVKFQSTARWPRSHDIVSDDCSRVFEVAMLFITEAAVLIKR